MTHQCAKLGLSLLIDSILGILLGAALGDVVLFGHDLGESPMFGVSLSPSESLSSSVSIHSLVIVLFVLKSYGIL